MSRGLLLAALLTPIPPPVLAQAAPPPAEPAQQLVDRLFRSMYGPTTDVQVTYRTVPGTLPVQLDPRLAVIASPRASGNNGQYIQHRILANTTLTPEEALAALTRSLDASGWKARSSYVPCWASPPRRRCATTAFTARETPTSR